MNGTLNQYVKECAFYPSQNVSDSAVVTPGPTRRMKERPSDACSALDYEIVVAFAEGPRIVILLGVLQPT